MTKVGSVSDSAINTVLDSPSITSAKRVAAAQLVKLVGGANSSNSYSTSQPRKQKFTASDQTFHNIAGGSSKVSSQPVAKATAEKAIPLDDSDSFEDFNS